MPVDARALIKPSVTKACVHPQSDTVLRPIAQEIRHIESKRCIPVIVAPDKAPVHKHQHAAEDAIKSLMGVTGVTNNITIKSQSMEAIEKTSIESALKRNWAFYDNDIRVSVSGHRATLTGTVNSLFQKGEAGSIAWNAPGVWSVNNELVVDWD